MEGLRGQPYNAVMLVRDVGEFELIGMLADVLETEESSRRADPGDGGQHALRLSIGDDAAAWDAPAGATVLTTDTMVAGVHFTTDTTSWRDLGWKAVAVNLSDIAAMGAWPTFSVVTLGLTGAEPVDSVKAMYEGMKELCGQFGTRVIGGDVVRAPVLFITVAMTGAAQEHGAPLLTRDAARPGDLIAVTGSLGCSAGGLALIEEKAETSSSPGVAHLLEAHRRPMPRVREGCALVRHGVETAMDVSDGLVADLAKLCEASRVSAVVWADRLPIDEHLTAAFPGQCLSMALEGGEDYELLFTAPTNVVERASADFDVPVTVIGEIRGEGHGVEVLDADGKPIGVGAGGWDHFGSGGTT